MRDLAKIIRGAAELVDFNSREGCVATPAEVKAIALDYLEEEGLGGAEEVPLAWVAVQILLTPHATADA